MLSTLTISVQKTFLECRVKRQVNIPAWFSKLLQPHCKDASGRCVVCEPCLYVCLYVCMFTCCTVTTQLLFFLCHNSYGNRDSKSTFSCWYHTSAWISPFFKVTCRSNFSMATAMGATACKKRQPECSCSCQLYMSCRTRGMLYIQYIGKFFAVKFFSAVVSNWVNYTHAFF